jgi:chloramphenicol-sensitive protein RarD
MNKGIWYAVGAYVAWGLFPVYWKWLHQVPALQLLSHRVVWSFLLLLSVFLLTRQWPAFRAAELIWRVLRIS